MPSEASSLLDFTNSGKRSLRGSFTRRPRGNTWNCGEGMRWNANTCLHSALSRDSSRPRGLQPV
jgi:hypothetical protein